VRAVLIVAGNPLRGDDGVAHLAAEWLKNSHSTVIQTQQLTPETAAELAGCDLAVFVDADIDVKTVVLEWAPEGVGTPSLSHWMHPGMVVALARKLYGFVGEAWWCRIPAREFSAGRPVSDAARAHAAEAAAMVRALLECSNA
jgi:Ni,Fe-hydrogenase maturation factor